MKQRQPTRKVHRSPNYPAFSLAEAIKRARVVYEHEKRSYTTPEIIVKHLGYSQTTGPGGRALSGLRQFGLIEEDDGKYRISELGFALLHYPEGSPERNAALRQAASKPNLFHELLKEYPNGLPSNATLTSNLLRRGFNPSVVEEAIRAIRGTMSLVAGGNVGYTDSEEEYSDVSGEQTPTTQQQPGETSFRGPLVTGNIVRQATHANEISTPVGTDDGQPVFAHLRFDAALRKEFVVSLKKYLDYLETTL